jgi:hypothetical protein
MCLTIQASLFTVASWAFQKGELALVVSPMVSLLVMELLCHSQIQIPSTIPGESYDATVQATVITSSKLEGRATRYNIRPYNSRDILKVQIQADARLRIIRLCSEDGDS